MVRRSQMALLFAAVLAATGLLDARLAMAQGQQKVQRAINFVSTPKRGKEIFSYLHFGSTYVDHEVVKALRVTGSDGQDVAGHVALKIVFDWQSSFGDNSTTALIFFDEKGDPYEIQCKPEDSTSIISPPFSLANGAIKILGSVILGAAGPSMTATEKANMQQAIDSADSRQLLIDALKVQMRLGL